MKVILNRCVFKTDLKHSKDDAFLISAGNLFHKVAAATLNVQSPYDLSRRDTGTLTHSTLFLTNHRNL
jgi:hypothetical protein